MERILAHPWRWLLLLLCFCAAQPAQAQNGIVAAEYFFDTDPGVGMAVSVPVNPGLDTLDLTGLFLPVTGLDVGFHRLVFRVKHANYGWGVGASSQICESVEPAGGADAATRSHSLGRVFLWCRSGMWTGHAVFGATGNGHRCGTLGFIGGIGGRESRAEHSNARFVWAMVGEPQHDGAGRAHDL